MKEHTLTKTVVCPLETSGRKNDRVASVIDQWQAIAGRVADLMPGLGPEHWRAQDTTLNNIVHNEFPNHDLTAHTARQAAFKVGEAFGSWHSNRHEEDRPTFGDGDYARFCGCNVDVQANDDGGWGVKIGLEPYDPEWWRIRTRPYVARHLEAITDGDARTGSAELHLDGSTLDLHLTVSRDIEVCEPADVETTVGVDLGERTLYAAAVVVSGETVAVEVETGDEFRHHRERLKRKRYDLSERGHLANVRGTSDLERYTDHVTHVASRRIVDLAVEHQPAVIRLEDLTGYRSGPSDPIHDWPFREVQEKVCYKATEEGIGVEFVDPRETSQTCSACGASSSAYRHRSTFECGTCGYQLNADVNAAKNIAAG